MSNFLRKNVVAHVVFGAFLMMFIAGCAKKRISNDETIQTDPFQEQATPQAPAEPTVPEVESLQEKAVQTEQEQQPEHEQIESNTIIGRVFFDYDRYNIKPSMQEIIVDAAQTTMQNRDMSVLVEGNTDEFGTDEYNLALGNRRALAIRAALISTGIDPNVIQILSFGKSKPLCFDKTNQCYQQNRRGDIKLVRR